MISHATYIVKGKGKNSISERVFYQACVMEQDITRTGDLETGRPSEPNFQSMNFESTRKYNGVGPWTVVRVFQWILERE